MRSRTSMVSRKNTMVINFAQICTQSRVSIDFSHIVTNFQNTSHSQCITHEKFYEHGFTKKRDDQKHYAKSSYNRFFMHRLRIVKYWPFPTY
ncbi:hypothetical protein GW17_00050622 [Ensete ventricosum]|nr:hypothetical protein GW17_00050622 [Ensete ventricosum]